MSASVEKGIQDAHLVYRVGAGLEYVYDVSDKNDMMGDVLTMPPSARSALTELKRYTDPTHPDCHVVVWRTNEAMCVAVSTMPKEQLLALLPASASQP